ncbi:hypothetical protein NST63_27285 [Heyndrickxia sp. FSL W8-0496]|uniref:hypothetical protein n=1 Tax=Heyndrickxia sp. FSL W8-0496 TaxID=2954702 RepID=UPI0030F74591
MKIYNLLKGLDWNEVNQNRIKRYEMLLKVTKHTVKRNKIIQHLNWLKEKSS